MQPIPKVPCRTDFDITDNSSVYKYYQILSHLVKSLLTSGLLDLAPSIPNTCNLIAGEEKKQRLQSTEIQLVILQSNTFKFIN